MQIALIVNHIARILVDNNAVKCYTPSVSGGNAGTEGVLIP